MSFARKLVAGCTVVGMLGVSGAVGIAIGHAITTTGSGSGDAASLSCPGGMTRLGHPVDENMSIFPGDPAFETRNLYTVAVDFFKVEDLDLGTHAGTHLDVPAHFLDEADGARTLDQFAAEEFVWPVYKIDVRGMSFPNNQIEYTDILAYEAANGDIPSGALVVLRTGAEEFFGLNGPGDEFDTEKYKDKATKEKYILSANTDDLFDFVNVGFSGPAVQWMFDNRSIDGVGSDAYGPDAATDELFDATYTTLFNDGVALVGIANLDDVNVNGDIIISSTVNLTNGSGFSTDPIACHGAPANDD